MTPNQIHGVDGVDKRITGDVSILDLVGNTPLIRLEKLTSHLQHVEVYGKAEYMNPAGSVKDRAALNMIRSGIESGHLTRDKIILDSTSGNTGIAYAMIGAVWALKSNWSCQATSHPNAARL
jgi:cysteine synthase B